MTLHRLAIAALIALFPLTLPAQAQHEGGHAHGAAPEAAEASIGALTVSGAFARATLPNAPVAGGYLTIANGGAEADRLVSAASPAAGRSELHEMKMEGDVMRMTALENGIDIPAGGTVTLAPGGLHIMFMDLAQPFVEGESVPLTLTFEKAGSIEVVLQVGPVGAAAAPHAGH